MQAQVPPRADSRGAHRAPGGGPDRGCLPGAATQWRSQVKRYWKYPLMSRIRWLKFVVYAVTAPLTPAGTSAAFATIAPSREFSVETRGCAPLPHNVRKLRDPVGTTVAFSEYACAVPGMPHVDDGTTKLRDP